MGKLEAMQRLAEREAAKLGIEAPLRVYWNGTLPRPFGDRNCRLPRRILAHAHCSKDDRTYGAICVRQGLGDWRDTIRHEVAHFAPGGLSHGVGFLKTRAAQGSKAAKAALVRAGKRRCPRHEWFRHEEKSRKVTAAGLTITYAAKCYHCGKEVG